MKVQKEFRYGYRGKFPIISSLFLSFIYLFFPIRPEISSNEDKIKRPLIDVHKRNDLIFKNTKIMKLNSNEIIHE